MDGYRKTPAKKDQSRGEIHERENRYHKNPLLLLLFTLGAGAALAQTSVFTYQGHLTDGGAPANGTYNMQFRLFDTGPVGTGTLIGSFSPPPVQVTSSGFTVLLDFGAGAFPGAARYLEMIVNGTPLNPRHPITSTPYAIRSLVSTSADTATNAAQLGGVAASRYVQADAAGNVSIGGNLTVNGALSLNTVNAQTQYNLGGQRILSASANSLALGSGSGNPNASAFSTFIGQGAGAVSTGGSNTFVGTSVGFSNTTGDSNSIFGEGSSEFNTTGSRNSYFGHGSGVFNLSGSDNAFFGYSAGTRNAANGNSFFGALAAVANTVGGANTFIGYRAGTANTTGPENSFLGRDAGVSNTTGGANTFIGFQSGFFNQTGFFNTIVGRPAHLAGACSRRLHDGQILERESLIKRGGATN